MIETLLRTWSDKGEAVQLIFTNFVLQEIEVDILKRNQIYRLSRENVNAVRSTEELDQ